MDNNRIVHCWKLPARSDSVVPDFRRAIATSRRRTGLKAARWIRFAWRWGWTWTCGSWILTIQSDSIRLYIHIHYIPVFLWYFIPIHDSQFFSNLELRRCHGKLRSLPESQVLLLVGSRRFFALRKSMPKCCCEKDFRARSYNVEIWQPGCFMLFRCFGQKSFFSKTYAK